jgi:hypothetical protein
MTSVLSISLYVGITCCFSLVILNFLIWQFTLTPRQIDKFKLLPIYHFRQNKENCDLNSEDDLPSVIMFYNMLKIDFLFVVDVSRNINLLLP